MCVSSVDGPYLILQGDLIYVNYGRVEDYDVLMNTTGLNVSGKIVLCRYGKIYRGDQVRKILKVIAIMVCMPLKPEISLCIYEVMA